ncbi:MAG: lyase family protein, partial [Candidatus Bathyarchaeia archaeon]
IYAMIATSLENFATEIRELQRPEIAEVFERFETKKQVGSSTMPHKQNPETCERVCGLARIIRSLGIPALENMVTWHERDLTQSSTERFILPESNILLDYIINLMINIVANLHVDKQRMTANMSLTEGHSMSESVMMTLVKKDVNRQEAHEMLRQLTIKSAVEKKPFKQILKENAFIRSKLDEKEIEAALNPKNYLGTAITQAEKFSQNS